jgi:L-fuculose-phosphate aldolase
MIGWRRRLAGEVVRTTRQMATSGLVHGTTGNVSARLGGRVLITPTRRGYDTLRPRHLVELSVSGERLRGGRSPSRELGLHLAVYARGPDVAAVVHAHGAASVAWGLLASRLPTYLEETSYYDLGLVRTVPEAGSGSTHLAAATAEALDHAEAALLMAHGLVAVGATLDEALHRALAVEHISRVALALAAGGAAHPGHARSVRSSGR